MGIDGVEGRPVGTIFWEPKLQKVYKYWLKEALTRPNPYCPDKTPLIDDPALPFFKYRMKTAYCFGRRKGSAGANLSALKPNITNGVKITISMANRHLK